MPFVPAESLTATAISPLDLYKVASDSLSQLWTAFSLVSLGVVGFVYKNGVRGAEPAASTSPAGHEGAATPTTSPGVIVFAAAYAAFAIGNNIAITNAHGALKASADAMRPAACCVMNVFEVWKVMTFHAVVAFLTFIAILAPGVPVLHDRLARLFRRSAPGAAARRSDTEARHVVS